MGQVGPVPPLKFPHPPPSDWQSSALHSAQSTEPADVEGVETEPGQMPSTLCRACLPEVQSCLELLVHLGGEEEESGQSQDQLVVQ